MKVALVLGSGGARGYAHIGVIEELKRRGHEIVAISGTSMGAIVGGVEAAGKLDDFKDWIVTLRKVDVLRLIGLTVREPGIVNAHRVMRQIDDIVEGVRIEDLAIPFTAVATNLITGREVWFQHGSLSVAMRASMAVPSVVTPVKLNGQLLADGGLVNPVPMEPVAAIEADFTLAVSLAKGRTANFSDPNLLGGNTKVQSSDDVVETDATDDENVGNNADVTEADSSVGATKKNRVPGVFQELPEDLKMRDVTELALSSMQALIERFRWAANPASVLVEIPYSTAGTMDLHLASKIIEVGREEAARVLDANGL